MRIYMIYYKIGKRAFLEQKRCFAILFRCVQNYIAEVKAQIKAEIEKMTG